LVATQDFMTIAAIKRLRKCWVYRNIQEDRNDEDKIVILEVEMGFEERRQIVNDFFKKRDFKVHINLTSEWVVDGMDDESREWVATPLNHFDEDVVYGLLKGRLTELVAMDEKNDADRKEIESLNITMLKISNKTKYEVVSSKHRI
jgi:hypothetical protein